MQIFSQLKLNYCITETSLDVFRCLHLVSLALASTVSKYSKSSVLTFQKIFDKVLKAVHIHFSDEIIDSRV